VHKAASYCCMSRDIIPMVMAKPSGARMLFPIVLLDEDLLSIDGVGWQR
jgi:hypothetical protein